MDEAVAPRTGQDDSERTNDDDGTPREFHPVADIFPLLDGRAFDDLVEDIRSHGLRESIWLHPDGRIVDGRNRYRACEAADVEPRFRTWYGQGSLVAFVVSLNLRRRHLDVSQRAMVAARIKPMFEAEARERQGMRTDLQANLPEGRQARDDAATAVNVSARSVEGASKVLRDGAPELIAAVEDGRVSVSAAVDIADAPEAEQREIVARGEKEILAAARDIREQRQQARTARKVEAIRRIDSDALAFPEGPFHVLVLDPPWRYGKRAEDNTHRGRCPYPDMSMEEICALPVARLAQPDAILWLWTTNAFMREAFSCLDAWGFQPKTILTWVKDRMGLGDWLRGQTEHCVLATRGRPVVSLTNQTTALQAPVREHSRKPDEFYTLVESLCPGSRVELFARQERAGWAAWGAETGQFDAARRGGG